MQEFVLSDAGRLTAKLAGIAIVVLIAFGVVWFMRWLKRATGNDWLNQSDRRD